MPTPPPHNPIQPTPLLDGHDVLPALCAGALHGAARVPLLAREGALCSELLGRHSADGRRVVRARARVCGSHPTSAAFGCWRSVVVMWNANTLLCANFIQPTTHFSFGWWWRVVVEEEAIPLSSGGWGVHHHRRPGDGQRGKGALHVHAGGGT